ncbi:MAG: EAL domain-containing protein [Ilumatobacteraceae bacterium]|nr:EAL domain-containing protein [Ilumatobacteraceae bacterium]
MTDNRDGGQRIAREVDEVSRPALLGSAISPHSIPAFDLLADPVAAIAPDGELTYANDAAAEVLGWPTDELVGKVIFDIVHPDDANRATAALQRAVNEGVGKLVELRLRTRENGWRYLEIRGGTSAADPALDGMIVFVARDITDRHRFDIDRDDTQLLRAVMANMQCMVLLVDDMGLIRFVNAAVTRFLGHAPEDLDGTMAPALLHEDDRDHTLQILADVAAQDAATFDARVVTSDNKAVLCEITIRNLLDDPGVGNYLITAQVATALTTARDRVSFLADHDSRTGLLNRDGFMRSAASLLEEGGGLGILTVDIVRFRSINELYGEPVGNAILAAVAARIGQIGWPDLIAARFGADEFMMAIRTSDPTAIQELRRRVLRVVSRPIVIDDQQVHFDVLSGTAFEAQPRVLDALFASASSQLLSAKQSTDPASGEISVDAINKRRRQLDHLRQALSDGQIQPHFQPIVDATGKVLAVEALVRWNHPVRGVLGVSEILPLARMAGLAEAIDDRVLESALRMAVNLTANNHREVGVHVNIDPKVLARPSFGESFLNQCHRIGANPAQLVVEITETDLLSPGMSLLTNMKELRHAGVHVSMDDFGTGYSSLAHLLELPVDGVKIDRRFVAGIDVDPAATNLTTAIISLSKSLELDCVAEGVEQPYQLERLAALGCEGFQGWLFSAALPADDLLVALPRFSIDPQDHAVATEDATP